MVSDVVIQPSGQVQNVTQQSRQVAGEPIFVAVPPKPQRLLHSEAYIKYIYFVFSFPIYEHPL